MLRRLVAIVLLSLAAPAAAQFVPQHGVTLPLWPNGAPGSEARAHEPEVARDYWVRNVHNPSVTMFAPDPGHANGAAVIVFPGGGHELLVWTNEGLNVARVLNRMGVTVFVVKYRLARAPGSTYTIERDAAGDARRAVRFVRAHAAEWKIDPHKIGVMGFSAGAELAMAAAIQYREFDAKNNAPADPLAGVSSRPDFVGSIYPGPSLFTKGGTPPIPKDAPPSFIVCAGWGDKVHAVWADEYFSAMLHAGIPNVEMHIYARGKHGGGMGYRDFTGEGTWPDRFIGWLRDLGYFQKAGVQTQADKDVADFVAAAKP